MFDVGLISHSFVDHCSWGVDFSLASPYLCLSYPSQCCPSPFVVKALLIQFSFPSWGDYSIYSCRFVVSVGGGKLRILLPCHLEPSFEEFSFFFWPVQPTSWNLRMSTSHYSPNRFFLEISLLCFPLREKEYDIILFPSMNGAFLYKHNLSICIDFPIFSCIWFLVLNF